MIPWFADLELDPALPHQARYWTPSNEELSSDVGFGFFHDTWVIQGVPLVEACSTYERERQLIALADDLAGDLDEFEQLATTLEYDDTEALPPRLSGGDAWKRINEHIYNEGMPLLEGLELGVAGLVDALSAAGCFPAASCRGHATHGAWATYPVVYVAIDAKRAHILERLVKDAACGFFIDVNRDYLLGICAHSISQTNSLARLTLEHNHDFVA